MENNFFWIGEDEAKVDSTDVKEVRKWSLRG